MKIRLIEPKDNLTVANIIRTCLTEYGGDHRSDTAWGDPGLEHFSDIYAPDGMAYWVAESDDGTVIAGVGIGFGAKRILRNPGPSARIPAIVENIQPTTAP